MGVHENKISFVPLSYLKHKTSDSVQVWYGAGQAFPAGAGEASLSSSGENSLSCAMGQTNQCVQWGTTSDLSLLLLN